METRIRLVDCLSPRNPVVLVRSGEDGFFYGVPRPESLEKHRDVLSIVVPRESLEAAEALRRLGLYIDNTGDYTVYVDYRSRIRGVPLVHGFKLVEVYDEARLGMFTLRTTRCGIVVEAEKPRLIITPPCEPHSLYSLLFSHPGAAGSTVVVMPLGPFEPYARRLEGLGIERVVVPSCSVMGRRASLELAGAYVLEEGEQVVLGND